MKKKNLFKLYLIFFNAITFLNLSLVLSAESSSSEEPGFGWYFSVVILITLLTLPWIYILFKYGFFRKLRIRFFDGEKEILPRVYLKKGAKIDLQIPQKDGYTFVGWFIDKELTEEFIDIPMPDRNMKLYAKFDLNNN